MPVDPLIARYRLPQVILPVDPDDIANKGYVDSLIFPVVRGFMGAALDETAGTVDIFLSLLSANDSVAEARIQQIITQAIKITRIRANLGVNSRTMVNTLTFREDGIDTLAAVTLTAGVGQKDSGVLDVDIAAGSAISLGIDMSVGTGTLHIQAIIVDFEFT